MSKPIVLVLRTAGTNCDRETKHAFEVAGARVEHAHINDVANRALPLEGIDIVALPGGFSYGDDVASGRILANELRTRLGVALKEFYDRSGLVLGICNGFQVLVKCGLLPFGDLSNRQEAATLVHNDSGLFEARWVTMTQQESPCVFTKGACQIDMPAAHAEGKFVVRDDEVLNTLKANNQIVFKYSDASGGDVGYPGNPNGSVEGIAGVCDPTGRVLGLMPHPERFALQRHHPQWTRREAQGKGEGDGIAIFRNAVDIVRT